MSSDQQAANGLGSSAPPAGAARTVGIHPLSQVAMRLQEVRDGGSRLKARDLVGLLLSHGARAWRASQPVTTIRLRAESAPGCAVVRIRFR